MSAFIEELKQKNDIVSVVSRYVPLVKKGRLYWGRCPFHGEKTPSFTVNEENQYYHCFGCKESGDVIKFVQKIENVDFMDAVKMMAEWAHMQLPQFSSTDNETIEAQKKKKERLLALMKETAKYYHANLQRKEAAPGLAYLAKRKVDAKMITAFGLGYSVDFQELITHLKHKGYTINEMLDAGVVKQKDGRYYDSIGGRLVFPIINEYGEVVGFGGRTLKAKVDFAKYLNTAETFLFKKQKILYGFNLIKAKKKKDPSAQIPYIIVVEGYMDVISLHSAGFTTAVASMGTALTPDQAKLVKRFTNNVVICYDGDFAGQKATIRGLEILKDVHDLNIKVVTLPEGLDPDDVIKQRGAQAYQRLVDEALPLTQFKLNYAKRLYNLENPDEKTKFLNKAIQILQELPDPVERESYIEYLRELTNTNRDFLRKMLANHVTVEEPKQESEPVLKTTKDVVQPMYESSTLQAEKFVLSSLLHKTDYASKVPALTQKITDTSLKQVAQFLEQYSGLEKEELIRLFKAQFEEENTALTGELLNYLVAEQTPEQAKQYYQDCVWLLQKNQLETKQKQLMHQLKCESDDTKRKQILNEIQEISLKLKSKKVE